MLKLDNRAARRLFLDRHGLGEAPGGPGHGAALEAVIGRLGFVQLDSINTVARAHDLILFARRPRYRPENLGRLVEGRALFEHWTHDAAVIPMAFYPAWALKRRRDAARLAQRYRVWQRHEFQTEFDRVLAMIRERGPVCSNDLGPDTPRKAGGWWDWHPAKTALEYLWRSGTLEICHRSGFRKFYDLSERVVPEALRAAAWDEAETVAWLMRGALARLGFATAGELADFWDIVTKDEARAWCAAALARGEIAEVAITGADGRRRCRSRPLPRPNPAAACGYSAPSTRRCATASGPNGCSAFTTGSRSSCPRPSGAMAITSFPCLRATGWSGAST